ncbi:MAG: hypothetical protein LZF62_410062 [Nitrospira sp.]|nr:MAG: hypothetical protein LZF62_410062 [Nitrospira sp.]
MPAMKRKRPADGPCHKVPTTGLHCPRPFPGGKHRQDPTACLLHLWSGSGPRTNHGSRRHHLKTGLDVSVNPLQLQAKTPRIRANAYANQVSVDSLRDRVLVPASIGVES